MKGSGLKVNLFGYVLDEDLSNLYGKVYVN